jgi:hypothetical protein
MKKRLVAATALLAAIGCLPAPTPSAAQSVAAGGPPDTLVTASAPRYPLPRTTFAEAIARYGIGSGHRAMYANITGDQMWSITQSTFGQPNAQSAIYEAKRLCETHALANKLDPGKCVPVAVDDRQVYDPGPLFSIAEQLRAQQLPVTSTNTQPQE